MYKYTMEDDAGTIYGTGTVATASPAAAMEIAKKHNPTNDSVIRVTCDLADTTEYVVEVSNSDDYYISFELI